MDENIYKLKQIGLTEKEARVYLSALEFGPVGIAFLSKKSNVKRTTIHQFIDELINKGFIEVTMNKKRKLYVGAPPEKLEEITERQKEIASSLLPSLNLLTTRNINKPKFRFYEGIEGVKTVFMDRINQPEGSEILFLSHYGESKKIFKNGFLNQYSKKRISRNISTRSILPSEKYSKASVKRNGKLKKVILVPEKDLPITSEISIYGDKIAILSYEEKVAIIMESNQIASSLKAVFNLLWKKLENK